MWGVPVQEGGAEAGVPRALRRHGGVDDAHGARHPRQLTLHRRSLQEHLPVSCLDAPIIITLGAA